MLLFCLWCWTRLRSGIDLFTIESELSAAIQRSNSMFFPIMSTSKTIFQLKLIDSSDFRWTKDFR